MYFFVFLTQLYLSKYIEKIYKTAILNENVFRQPRNKFSLVPAELNVLLYSVTKIVLVPDLGWLVYR